MTRVFIGGSRRLSRLRADVTRRIDTIIRKGFTIVVGDANGADKAVQRHLAAKSYQNVIVFCMTGDCRNNIGGWPTRSVTTADAARRDFVYFSTKDRAMVDDASHGLMLWDGRSKGTLNNVINLVRQRKPVVVYFAPTKTFHTVRTEVDVGELLANCDRATAARFERELGVMSAGAAHVR